MRSLIVAGRRRPVRAARRRLARHGLRRHLHDPAAGHRGRALAAASAAVHLSEVGTSLVSGVLALEARQRRLAHRRHHGPARRARRLRRRDLPVQPARRHRRTRGWPALLLRLGGYVLYRFLVARRPASAVQGPPLAAVPRSARPGRRADGRHRRRRLGPGRHHDAAVVGPARAAQGGRLDRHLRVRRRGRRVAGLPVRRWAVRGSSGAYAAALLAGGVVAAPIAAWLVRRPARRASSASWPAASSCSPTSRPSPRALAPTVWTVVCAGCGLGAVWLQMLVVAVRAERRARVAPEGVVA